ncbi:tripartite motif-containing protein 2-like isoform X2 [Haliotis rufescens]|nr:tripartite motif-containing protein 2-like isoform X2 [Haliotis rufescens]XP_048248534.1 tripartite motif-containing protein 2-like isoform X2 [Haliotis rufescens]
MATSRAEKVMEFLTCVICQELYTDPCTLRCDHTFCRKCVTGYIQTRPDAVQSKTIPCAFCRQDTKVPDPSRPVEEWAGQIKPSIIIQGLIDTQESARRTTGDDSYNNCCLCDKLGETTPGTAWCSDCEESLCGRCSKIHHESSATGDHELCDLPGDVKVKKTRKVMCQEHKDKKVEYLCLDCIKSLCQSCCVVYHRKCDSVVTISSQMTRIKLGLSRKVNGLKKKLFGKSKKIEKQKSRVSEIKDNKASVKKHIRSTTNRLVEHIKHKEKKLLDELDTKTDTHISQVCAAIKLEEIEMQMYRQHCEFIDQALVSDCEMDLYDAYQAWESGAVELGDVRDTNTADTRRIDAIRFTPDTDNVQHILDDLQLGKIGVTYQTGTCRKSYPVMVDTTDGWMEEDVEEPDLHDVTVLLVNGIQTCVVTDAKNKFVKSFYTTNNQPCHSRLPLDDSPSGVTQLKENQVMVAVPDSSQIVTVEVIPDLVLLSTITTSKGYYSLAVLSPSSLAAGGSACVDILDMTGDVLRSVTTHNSETLFTYPAYMCVNNKGNILVSDWGKTSVTCVTSEGDVVWRYAPTGGKALSIPAGISTTKKGDIMVVDKDAETMIQLKETGEYVSDVITSQDGINQPLSLCIDKHDSVLVTCGREIKTFILT